MDGFSQEAQQVSCCAAFGCYCHHEHRLQNNNNSSSSSSSSSSSNNHHSHNPKHRKSIPSQSSHPHTSHPQRHRRQQLMSAAALSATSSQFVAGNKPSTPQAPTCANAEDMDDVIRRLQVYNHARLTPHTSHLTPHTSHLSLYKGDHPAATEQRCCQERAT